MDFGHIFNGWSAQSKLLWQKVFLTWGSVNTGSFYLLRVKSAIKLQLYFWVFLLLSARTAMWSIQWIWQSGKMIMIHQNNAYQWKSMRITINTLIFIYLSHLALDHWRGKTLFLCDSCWFSMILANSWWFSPILADSWITVKLILDDSHWFSNQSEIDSHWSLMILTDSWWFLMILTDSQWFLPILGDSHQF